MIYADYNATTPLSENAARQMETGMKLWGNPSSSHSAGRKALELLNSSRESVARVLGINPLEVAFTSGGSEANTTVLIGACLESKTPFHLITSKMEHSSVLGTCQFLETRGAKVSYVRALPSGALDLDHFQKLLNEGPVSLVSLMTANNETGVMFPVAELLASCRAKSVPFHTDAVQALGKVPSNVFNQADFISVSAHKIRGPKGVGAMIVRHSRQLVPLHYGGSQEIKRRGGTENVVGIAGFGGACAELATGADWERVHALRDRFEAQITSALEGIQIIGQSQPRLPNTSSLRVTGIAAEVLLSSLDLDGICISAGSACSSGSISPSHVLLALGLEAAQARECLRVSWGTLTTEAEVDTVAAAMISHVTRIRARRKGNQ